MPARKAIWRAVFNPVPAWRTCPNTTSSTSSGAMPALVSADSVTVLPSSAAGTVARAPPNLPMAVRTAPAMTTSRIGFSSEVCVSAVGCLTPEDYERGVAAYRSRSTRRITLLDAVRSSDSTITTSWSRKSGLSSDLIACWSVRCSSSLPGATPGESTA